MLSGPELGRAIEEARRLKGVTKKAMAEHFKVSQPSIQDWVKRGTIDKKRLEKLWAYFSDVVDMEHWGVGADVQAKPQANEADPADYSAAARLESMVQQLVDTIASLPGTRWSSVRAQLDILVNDPGKRPEVAAELRLLLGAAAWDGTSDRRAGPADRRQANLSAPDAGKRRAA